MDEQNNGAAAIAPTTLSDARPAASDVFISYSRTDRAFVVRLQAELAGRGRQVWVDWADIPPTAEWMTEIETAIRAANAFVVVLSPDSAASKVCSAELQHAIDEHKRIVPILLRDVPPERLPEAVAKLNWIFFRPEDDFDASLDLLLVAMDTDLERVRSHTRLLVEAGEWEQREHHKDRLLRGSDLTDAEHWLDASASGEPQPTTTQTLYIAASRRAASHRQRGLLAAVAAALVVSIALSGFALVQMGRAHGATNDARHAASLAEARSLDTQAVVANDISSVRLARQAVAIDPTLASESDLLSALLRQPIGARRVWTASSSSVNDGWIAAGQDPSVVAVYTHSGAPFLLDTTTGSVVPMPGIDSGRFIGDGRRFLGYSELDNLRWSFVVFDTSTGRPDTAHRLPGPATATDFSSDGRTIAAVSPDGRTLTLRRFAHMAITRVVHTRRPFLDVVMLPRGRFFTATSVVSNPGRAFNGPVEYALWGRGSVPERVITRDPGGLGLHAISRDGRFFVLDRPDGSLEVSDLKTGSQLVLHTPSATRGVAVESNRKILAASGRGWIETWNLLTGHAVTRFATTGRTIDIAFGSDGTTLFSLGSTGEVTAWDLIGSSGLRRTFQASNGSRMSISPDGGQIALASDTGISILDTARLHALGRFRSKNVFSPLVVAFGPDGRDAVVAGFGGVERWRTDPWSPVGPLVGPPFLAPDRSVNAITTVAYSPDGATIAAGDSLGQVYLWDARTGRPRRPPIVVVPVSVRLFLAGVSKVAFSPDGATIAVLGNRGRGTTASPHLGVLTFIDARTGASVRSVNIPPANDLAFSHSGGLVAVGCGDGTVLLINAVTAQVSGTSLTTTGSEVNGVDFSPSGRELAVATYDGAVRIFDVGSRSEIGPPIGASDKSPATAQFTPDGSALVLLRFNGQGELLDVRPSSWDDFACSLAGPMTPAEWQTDIPSEPYMPVCR